MGVPAALAAACRELQGQENSAEDFEGEDEKLRYEELSSKRAALRGRAERAPPGDLARLSRAAWRKSLAMAEIRQRRRLQGVSRSGWGRRSQRMRAAHAFGCVGQEPSTDRKSWHRAVRK